MQQRFQSQEGFEQWWQKIAAPPAPFERPPTPEEREAEGQAFAAFAGAMGVMPPRRRRRGTGPVEEPET